MSNSVVHKQINYFLTAHRRSGNPVNIYYPRKSFPGVSVAHLRTYFNRFVFDCKSKYIPEQEALIIYDVAEVSE